MPADRPEAPGELPILAGSVAVEMPPLPMSLRLTTEAQLRAIMDPLRSRILGILLHQPLTAKHLADRLGVLPGSVGHHLRTLEAAGLVQAVARRQTRGTVATYYTRTARIYEYDAPHDVAPELAPNLHIITVMRNELAEALALNPAEALSAAGFPHARLSEERARSYQDRLMQLIDEFVREPIDPAGQVYGLGGAFFLAPPSLQPAATDEPTAD